MYGFADKKSMSGKRMWKEEYKDVTGIPEPMKNYVEKQSGLSFDDVRVHYNSNRPEQFGALGYTQGRHVYLKANQEKHLMHELWHVAQQKKGLVKPTAVWGGHAVNNSARLEKEAEFQERQYNRQEPMQMLLAEAAKGSAAMDGRSLTGDYVYRYHVLAKYNLEGYGENVVWSDRVPGTGKGNGDHAEDAICDTIEILADYYGEDFRGKKLTIQISSCPCQRCQARLNDLKALYGLDITVISAKQYGGQKGGGAGGQDQSDYEGKVLGKEEAQKLLQF